MILLVVYQLVPTLILLTNHSPRVPALASCRCTQRPTKAKCVSHPTLFNVSRYLNPPFSPVWSPQTVTESEPYISNKGLSTQRLDSHLSSYHHHFYPILCFLSLFQHNNSKDIWKALVASLLNVCFVKSFVTILLWISFLIDPWPWHPDSASYIDTNTRPFSTNW
jgi:hypothetical protein